MLRVGAEPGADRDRQPLRRLELEAQVGEGGPEAIDGGLHLDDGLGGGDEQELVGAVAAHDAGLGQVTPELLDDREEGLVAGAMAVVVVEQPEVVDVDEGDPERRPSRSCALDLGGQVRHQRSVIERVGQRIAPRRLDEGRGLARQPALGRAEDEEQQHRGDDRGGQRDRDDVPSDAGRAARGPARRPARSRRRRGPRRRC